MWRHASLLCGTRMSAECGVGSYGLWQLFDLVVAYAVGWVCSPDFFKRAQYDMNCTILLRHR